MNMFIELPETEDFPLSSCRAGGFRTSVCHALWTSVFLTFDPVPLDRVYQENDNFPE